MLFTMGNTKTERGLTENGIQRSILDLLAAERVFAIRFNTGAFRDKRGVPVMLHSGGRGLADIQAFPVIRFCAICQRPLCECDNPGMSVKSPAVLWIEVKRPGGKQSPEQIGFEQRVKNEGHFYIVVTNPEDVLNWLRKYGAKK